MALFLLIFAIATVTTVASTIIITVSSLRERDAVLLAGTAMLGIAVIAWTYVYLKVGWWSVKEIVNTARNIQRKRLNYPPDTITGHRNRQPFRLIREPANRRMI